jgi:hypothetical protein
LTPHAAYVNRLAKSSFVTLAPSGAPAPACGATRFRWGMHVSLPFPLPSRVCIHRVASTIAGEFDFSLHNGLDRLFLQSKQPGSLPQVSLIPRGQAPPPSTETLVVVRDGLQSVAAYVEKSEAVSQDDAFKGADQKIKACFQHLSDFLAAFQSSAPYLASWQVYPISQFDVGCAFHVVEHLCPTSGRWEHLASGMTFNLARQLQQPLCHLDAPAENRPALPSDLSNELLAEAQLLVFRGLTRLAVINSYQAVESLANVVFKQARTTQLLAAGRTASDAEHQAEDDRKANRTRIQYLVHTGLQPARGRSLCSESKEKYDQLLALQKVRNQVVHAGLRPSVDQAESGHLVCCEVVQWLCEVGKLPVRALLPDEKDIAPGLQSAFQDANVLSPVGRQFLRQVLGLTQ